MTAWLRRLLPVAVFAMVGAGCAAQPSTPGPGECVPVKDGVSYAYEWNNAQVSITLSPINDSGIRCEDVTVSLVGWQQINYPSRWPQRVVTAQSITLAKDSDVPLKATIKTMCQNDAYWGPAPEIGMVNTAGGVPWKETFVNHQLPHGTGANYASDPMTGGLTANIGPCGPVTPEESPTPTATTTHDPDPSPTSTPSPTGPCVSPKDGPTNQERSSSTAPAGETENPGRGCSTPTMTAEPTPTESSTCVAITISAAPSPATNEGQPESTSEPTPSAGSDCGESQEPSPSDSPSPSPTKPTCGTTFGPSGGPKGHSEGPVESPLPTVEPTGGGKTLGLLEGGLLGGLRGGETTDPCAGSSPTPPIRTPICEKSGDADTPCPPVASESETPTSTPTPTSPAPITALPGPRGG